MHVSDDLFDEDISSEGSDDYAVEPDDFKEIFVVPSDWTVSTLRRELADIIDLSPNFQRRSIWTAKAKSKFIESLALGIPIPQILLAERPDYRNKYVVLDGKQRLTAIKEFFDERSEDGGKFSLTGLDDLKELNNKTWSDIKANRNEIARAIEGAVIRTAVIRGWKNDNVLYEIFHRLNSGSVKLSPMELRMSLIRGPFVQEIISQSARCNSLQKALNLKYPDKRMKDVEVAVRHLAFHSWQIPYRGNLKEFLDNFCRHMNKNPPSVGKISALDDLETAIDIGMTSLGQRGFSRKYLANDDRFEGQFNRAIFDVLAGSLLSPDVQRNVEKDPSKFLDIYKSAFNSTSFVKSIETTTKSISATKFRFEHWYGIINKEFGVELRMPLITENA